MFYVSELYSLIGAVTMLHVSELYCTGLCSNCTFHIVTTVREDKQRSCRKPNRMQSEIGSRKETEQADAVKATHSGTIMGKPTYRLQY